MIPFSQHRISFVFFGIFFLALLGYGYYEAQGILYGPRIAVPESAGTSHEQFVQIQGTATHIASIKMNGRQIPVTEAGAFSEPYLLSPGSNQIILEAQDKYAHTIRKTVDIFYVPEATAEATSTPTSSPSTPTVETATSTEAPPSAPTGEEASSTPSLAQ